MVSRVNEGKLTADDSELPDNRLCSRLQVRDYNSFFVFTAFLFDEGAQLIQSRSLVIVLAVSFLVHAALLVGSAKHEVERAQKPVGELLAAQLASNAAPLIMNKDRVGLGLMADRFGQAEGVLRLKVTGLEAGMQATGGKAPTLNGPVFQAAISLEQKPLGTAELVLASPATGEILRSSSASLLFSLLMHLLFGSWLIWPERFANIRVPILQPLPPLRRNEPEPEGEVAEPLPLPPAATVFLQISLEDTKGLLQRVNATTADQMLVIMEKLLQRAARLYQGRMMHAFGPEGATVRFEGDDSTACVQRALACARLFLSLADAAYQLRRNAKLFILPVKAAITDQGGREEGLALDEVMQLARRGNARELLITGLPSLIDHLKAATQLETLCPPPAPVVDASISDEPPAGETDAAAETTTDTPPEVTASTWQDTGPWRILKLSEADEARILEQKQRIMERRKAAIAGENPAPAG